MVASTAYSHRPQGKRLLATNGLVRYLVKANGKVIDHAETKEKAWRKAVIYRYECENQEVPFSPFIEVVKETLEN